MDNKKNRAYFHRKKEAENFQRVLKEKLKIGSEILTKTIDNRVYYVVLYIYNKVEA